MHARNLEFSFLKEYFLILSMWTNGEKDLLGHSNKSII